MLPPASPPVPLASSGCLWASGRWGEPRFGVSCVDRVALALARVRFRSPAVGGEAAALPAVWNKCFPPCPRPGGIVGCWRRVGEALVGAGSGLPDPPCAGGPRRRRLAERATAPGLFVLRLRFRLVKASQLRLQLEVCEVWFPWILLAGFGVLVLWCSPVVVAPGGGGSGEVLVLCWFGRRRSSWICDLSGDGGSASKVLVRQDLGMVTSQLQQSKRSWLWQRRLWSGGSGASLARLRGWSSSAPQGPCCNFLVYQGCLYGWNG